MALVSSVTATLGIGFALAHADRTPTVGVSPVASGGTAATGAPAAPTSSASSSPAASGNSAVYADGTYAGAVTAMRFGDVQVQVTIESGKITAVKEIRSPSDRKSVAINTAARPILESEAVASQSAKINAVSGATYTSVAYKTSLQAALDQAAARSTTSATATG